MREIKLRGLAADGKMVFGDLVKRDGKIYIVNYRDNLPEVDKCRVDSLWHEVPTETVGQYIGLKDKNGRDIYEGDIVTGADFEKSYIIMWNIPKCEFSAYCQDLELISNVLFFENKEILGNIHQNPKLAEGE